MLPWNCSYSPIPGRPPSSTLFPYTTLFRSGDGGGGQPDVEHALGPAHLGQVAQLRRDGTGHGRVGPRARRVDRKSTRLNSSHRCISYAVFCLKKKKKKSDEPTCRLLNVPLL